MKETWKDIKGYDGLYQVSNIGHVKSLERTTCDGRKLSEKILKPKTINGYLQVGLSKNTVVRQLLIHRLVADAFIPNDDLFATTVNHKNEVKTDNRVENLEWMSHGDNSRYSHRDGGTADNRGSKHPQAKQVRCVETGQVFGTAMDASICLGLNKQSVSNSMRKGYRCGGYHWEYLKDNEGLCNASQRT